MERPHRSTGKRLATVPLPPVSSTECVRVLVRLGWLPLRWNKRECVLERGELRMHVPLDERFGGTDLASLFDDAGVSLIRFVDELERVRTGRMSAYADRVRLGTSA